VCHMSHPPHPPWFNRPNNIGWRIQAMMLIIMQFSQWSIFLPFRSKYPPRNPFPKNLQSMFLPQVRDQISHPYSTIGKITVLYILILSLFGMRREDKRFWIE
jgi:hypothetical protein